MLNWIKLYLFGRSYKETISDVLSGEAQSLSGLCQGPISGPFLLHIIDHPAVLDYSAIFFVYDVEMVFPRSQSSWRLFLLLEPS